MIKSICERYGIKPMTLSEEAAMPPSIRRTRENKIYMIDAINLMRKQLDSMEFVVKQIPERDDDDHSQLIQKLREKVAVAKIYVEDADYFSHTGKGGRTTMTKERAMYLAGRALGELIYNEEGCDPDEMKEWVRNEFEMNDDEFAELEIN